MTPAEQRQHALRFLRVIVPSGGVVELRCLLSQRRTDAGYFNDLDTGVTAALARDGSKPTGIYVTLNPIDPALLARAENRIKEWADKTTTDANVTRRRWLFVDLDPERVAGVSATDAEHQSALQRAEEIREALMTDHGWHAPIAIDSGNGAYLLFPVDMPNDAESLKLIESTLQGLATLFNRDGNKIDAAVGNAARILRLPGTLNRKGDSTADRPHRHCSIIDVPDYLESGWGEPIDRAKLEAVAAFAPKMQGKANTSASTFKGPDRRLLVDAWLSDRGIRFERKESEGRTVYAMDCPFNPEHTGEANVTQQASGALSAKCFHASCAGRGWADFRDAIGSPVGHHFDPPKQERRKRSATTPANASTFGDDDERDPEIPINPDDNRWTSIRHDEGRTDATFSRRFLQAYGDQVLWVPQWKSWLVWDGCRWKIDDGGCAVTRYAQSVSDAIWHEVAGYHVDDSVDFATDMSKPSRWGSALKAAAAQRATAVSELNTNRWLLPCPNGTVDLRSGQLREHRKEDLLTTLCPTEYDPDAPSYHWDRFLEGAVPSQPMQDYLQRLCGYSLAGRVAKTEELLPVLWGDGSNGKSVFVRQLRETVGSDFAGAAAHGLLTEKTNDRHATERASLYGKRFVFCSETGRGSALDEDLVKAMTGGDYIKARFCHKDEFEFDPTFTIFLITNHRPRVRGTDSGIWRRLSLTPWTQRFWCGWKGETGPDELKADPELRDKLFHEQSGTLAWLVRGCLEWQRDGLKAPDEVRIATAEYRTAEDIVGQFVAQCCLTTPNQTQVRVRFNDLYARFEEWCEANGERAPKGRAVSTWLQEHGYQAHTSNGRWYLGIALQA